MGGETPPWVGWLCVLGAVVCFGSFGVPIKSTRVREANVHPFVFQTYKSFWVFATCWFVLLARPFNFTWWGVVSGLSWVPAGAAYVIGVQHVGLAINQALSSSLVVAVSTFWGVVIFHEPLHSVPLATLAFLMLVAGISTMAYFSVPKSAPSTEDSAPDASNLRTSSSSRRRSASRDGVLVEGGPSLNQESLEEPPLLVGAPASSAPLLLNSGSSHKSEVSVPAKKKNIALGIGASVFNGIWGGSVMVPLKLGGSSGGIDFVVSFGCGVAIVTCSMWIIFVLALRLQRRPIPSLQLRVMLLPGSIAGIVWSAGNFFSTCATILLGEAIGYSSCQAAIMVSGLWGLLYYKEAVGSFGAFMWSMGACICTGGIILLATLSG